MSVEWMLLSIFICKTLNGMEEDLPMVEARDGTYYMGGVRGGLGLGEYNQLDYLALIPSFPQAPNIYIA